MLKICKTERFSLFQPLLAKGTSKKMQLYLGFFHFRSDVPLPPKNFGILRHFFKSQISWSLWGPFVHSNSPHIWQRSAPFFLDLITPPCFTQNYLKKKSDAQKVPKLFWIALEPPLWKKPKLKLHFFGEAP